MHLFGILLLVIIAIALIDGPSAAKGFLRLTNLVLMVILGVAFFAAGLFILFLVAKS